MRGFAVRALLLLTLCAGAVFGQVGNATITGTVTDPSGAVIAGAAVEVKNAETGVVYAAVSTTTGSYTAVDLPAATYSVTVKVQGFKTYTHTNLTVGTAQILREDVSLQVGSAGESVTVNAEASLLKTETGDMSHNIGIDTLVDLPLLGIGTGNSGTTGVRNPYNALETLPGVSGYSSSGQFTLNGLGGNMTETMRVEGQDATSRLFGTYNYTQMGQPNTDAIQEVSYQTSNFAAEFGQAGSAVINMTMKSGSNAYHGTGYDYFVNEDLNAGNPFSATKDGVPTKYDPRNRRQDFGGTLGGPVVIPKLYNGRNKTFFFWSYEEFLESTFYSFTDTVPAAPFLKGDFSGISPNGNCSLCSQYAIQATALPTTDALGRPVYANEIYDPLTRATTASGLGYSNPFPNNQIPATRFDPVTQKILALVPAAQNTNLVGNLSASISGSRYSAIPSIKIDQNISSKDKLSFYWSRINTESQISSPLGGADGLPLAIGAYRGTFIPTYTTRVNYDRTIKPNVLLHLGAGYYQTTFLDHAPVLDFDPASVGLSGFLIHRQFPSITGNVATTNLYGGMQNLGEAIQTLNHEEKPSFTSSLTYIRGNHTYKVGAELYFQGNLNGTFSTVSLVTGTGPTSQPYTFTGSTNGYSTGFGFASWLLGDYSSTAQVPQENYKQTQPVWDFYLQDTWKVTRKLTVDYGIRYDYAGVYKEQYGRLGQFDPNTPNASAGGHLGATQYANTCNCQFYRNPYSKAFGPRLGIAYQINDKTVFRGGFGVNYQFVNAAAGSIVTSNGAYPLAGINPFVNIETPGAIVQPQWPISDPSRYPTVTTANGVVVNTVTGAPLFPDTNNLRPPRVTQWSLGFQRSVTRDLLVDAAYVGNYGVWEQGAAYAGNGPLAYMSQISPQQYASLGLYPYPGSGPTGYNNDADRALLSQPPNSAAVIAKFGHAMIPYTGFAGTTLLSALYPYPQFGALLPSNSPTGDSKYNALQVKITKRMTKGLQANASYTWAKGFSVPNRQDFFNPQTNPWQMQNIPPQVLSFTATYTMQKYAFLPKAVNMVTKDWQFGYFGNYQSGIFLTPPTTTTALFLGSQMTRVPGVPLYLKDINNIHSYNPWSDQILNPAAWQQIPTNGVGPALSTLYSDFRGPRQPHENANIGRHFRIKEKYDFYIRGEFVNIFNRTIMPNPISNANPQVAPTSVSAYGTKIYTGGFGVINAYFAPGTNAAPSATSAGTALVGRTGTVIMRFQF